MFDEHSVLGVGFRLRKANAERRLARFDSDILAAFIPDLVLATAARPVGRIAPDEVAAGNDELWERIFTHDCFGSLTDVISSVSGKPAEGCWLVIAKAMTVPER